MKKMLKNNIGLKILAILSAIFLWWIVVNVDDPVDDKLFNVDVTVTNPEVITNAGKSFRIAENDGAVAVTVKGRRKVLSEIKKENVIATADLREMQDSSVPVRVTVNGFEGDYEEVSAKPRNIQVIVENTQKKTFPITPVASGVPRDGYIVGNMIVEPQTVDISGPESFVKKISKVVARVDVDELATDTDISTDLLYYDAADNLIDKSLLTSNCDRNGVTVGVDLWRTKKLNISFDVSGIHAASGYKYVRIEVEPESVEVAGTDERLVELRQISVGREALERSNLTSSEEVVVDITRYLPEGVRLVDADASNIVVRIIIDRHGTKTLPLPTGRIRVEGLSDRLELEWVTLGIDLTFSGPDAALDLLNDDAIEVSVDLSAYTEPGEEIEVPVRVTKMPENCTFLEGVTVKIKLTRKSE